MSDVSLRGAPLVRKLLAEGTGTALLLMMVVGSGIMAERLSGGNVAVALLANSLATGLGLYVLITLFGPVSGAHFNPLVSLAAALDKKVDRYTLLAYVLVQCIAAIVGVLAAHAMFALPLLQTSAHARSGMSQWFAEFIATAGLLLVIGVGVKRAASQVPALVACYIASAYWFTASTSFANPAVTIARALSDTFAGIYPLDVPGFLVAQLAGALSGWWLAKKL